MVPICSSLIPLNFKAFVSKNMWPLSLWHAICMLVSGVQLHAYWQCSSNDIVKWFQCRDYLLEVPRPLYSCVMLCLLYVAWNVSYQEEFVNYLKFPVYVQVVVGVAAAVSCKLFQIKAPFIVGLWNTSRFIWCLTLSLKTAAVAAVVYWHVH